MKGVISVSGLGLMIGIKAEKPTPEIIAEGIERGVLFLSAKDKLRLLPPLNITYEEIDEALAILAEILEK
jgi:acetylornithine/N-succinyldiaminopimelate aminotransferase